MRAHFALILFQMETKALTSIGETPDSGMEKLLASVELCLKKKKHVENRSPKEFVSRQRYLWSCCDVQSARREGHGAAAAACFNDGRL